MREPPASGPDRHADRPAQEKKDGAEEKKRPEPAIARHPATPADEHRAERREDEFEEEAEFEQFVGQKSQRRWVEKIRPVSISPEVK
jgi:hypothetical protein